jgi:putative ATP-dependent endonuclease of OLD family
MKIESLQIKNLRSFVDVTIPFHDYTCLVGANGAGKSTVLCALNIFFRETDNSSTDLTLLTEQDFHQRNTSEPIEITVTFKDLSPDAQGDFAEYYRHGKLVVSSVATFNNATGKAEVKQMGQRMVMPAFKEFFKAIGDKKLVPELRKLYDSIRTTCTELPNLTGKDAMIAALRAHETAHPEQCELIPSEDHFYGVSKGADRLGKYIQWVYVPAVKDAVTEQVEARNSALGKLLSRTVRSKTKFDDSIRRLQDDLLTQYQKLLDDNQSVLDAISASLKQRLTEWAHPDATLRLLWSQDPGKVVRIEEPFARILAGEGDFEGDLTHFGHGLQRSYLLILLQELASTDDISNPRLILGCEEPELYQHPPQARHLASVLQKLSIANSQVVISTHSPLFVSGEGFEDVRVVKRDRATKSSSVAYMNYADIAAAAAAASGAAPKQPSGVLAKIHQALQPALSEMFFTPRLILVEGLEDVAYITAYLNLMGRWDDFRRARCHVVPVNGKSEMIQPLIIAKHVGIATYVVFDSDADKPDRNGSRKKHEKDNATLLALAGHQGADPMPTSTMWGKGFVMWHSDIGTIVRDDVGPADWDAAQTAADQEYGLAGDLKKNSLHIGSKLAHVWGNAKRSPQLERLCLEILDVSNSV